MTVPYVYDIYIDLDLKQMIPVNESVMAFRDKHISHIGTCDAKCKTFQAPMQVFLIVALWKT